MDLPVGTKVQIKSSAGHAMADYWHKGVVTRSDRTSIFIHYPGDGEMRSYKHSRSSLCDTNLLVVPDEVYEGLEAKRRQPFNVSAALDHHPDIAVIEKEAGKEGRNKRLIAFALKKLEAKKAFEYENSTLCQSCVRGFLVRRCEIPRKHRGNTASLKNPRPKNPTIALVVKQLETATFLISAAVRNVKSILKETGFSNSDVLGQSACATLKSLNSERDEDPGHVLSRNDVELYSEAATSAASALGSLLEIGNAAHTSAMASFNEAVSRQHPLQSSKYEIPFDRHAKEVRSIPVLRPIQALVRTTTGARMSDIAVQNANGAALFIVDLCSFIISPRSIPTSIAHLGRAMCSLPMQVCQQLKASLPIIPDTKYMRKVSRERAASFGEASSFGTVPAPVGTAARAVLVDNFGHSFTDGVRKETTTCMERFIPKRDDMLSLTEALQSSPFRFTERPMHSTGLNYDPDRWAGSPRADALAEFSTQFLIVAVEESGLSTRVLPVEDLHLGDSRRTISGGGLFPKQYRATRSDGVNVVERMIEGATGVSDGLNAWRRNQMRLLRQKDLVFAQAETMDKIALEAFGNQTSEDKQLVLLSGDMAPIHYWQGSKRRALQQHYQEKRLEETGLANNTGEVSQLPRIPETYSAFSNLLALNEDQRLEAAAIPQHDPDGAVNEKWLSLRVARFTASNAANIVGTSSREIKMDDTDAHLATLRSRVHAHEFDKFHDCRSPIAALIYSKPFKGNVYTNMGNEYEEQISIEVNEALSQANPDKEVLIQHPGILVHPFFPMIAASLDGLVQISDASGGAPQELAVLEIKLEAKVTLQFLENPASCDPPKHPWGVNAEPPGSPSWEIFDTAQSTFVSCAFDPNTGPAKFAHYVQMNVQHYVAAANGHHAAHLLYAVWNPKTKLRLYRTKYNKDWTEGTLVRLLLFSHEFELFPAARDFQSRHPGALGRSSGTPNEDSDEESDDDEATVVAGLEAIPDVGATIPEIEATPDLSSYTQTKTPAVLKVLSDPMMEVYSASHVVAVNGSFHKSQVNVTATLELYANEIECLLENTDLYPAAKTSEGRMAFLLHNGSLNKSTDVLTNRLLPGLLLFWIEAYRASTGNEQGMPGAVQHLREWVAEVTELYPALRRLDGLTNSVVLDYLQRSAQKPGGLYEFEELCDGLEVEKYAAVGHHKYTDGHIDQVLTNETASDENLVSVKTGSEINMGSHFIGLDLAVENLHDQFNIHNTTARCSSSSWLAKQETLTVNGPKQGGELHSFGSHAPSKTTGAFGDITARIEPCVSVTKQLLACFPSLPSHPSSVATAELLDWIDLKQQRHSAGDMVALDGSVLNEVDLDPMRAGRTLVTTRVWRCVFGQGDDQPVLGTVGDDEKNMSASDPRLVLGQKRGRLPTILQSKTQRAAQQRKSLLCAKPNTTSDVLEGFQGSLADLRRTVRVFQESASRLPHSLSDPNSINDQELNTSNGGTKEDVALCYLAWKKKEGAFTSTVDLSGISDTKNRLSAVHEQIKRNVSSIERGKAARAYVRRQQLWRNRRTEADAEDVETQLPEMPVSSFVEFIRSGNRGGATGRCLKGHRSQTAGGKCSMLNKNFEGVASALDELVSVLPTTTVTCAGTGHRTKEGQLAKHTERAEADLIRLIKGRREREEEEMYSASGSFWSKPGSCPPPVAGDQCKEWVNQHCTDEISALPSRRGGPRAPKVRIEGAYGTYTFAELVSECKRLGIRSSAGRPTLMKYLRVPSEAPKAHDPLKPETWTTVELRAHLGDLGLKNKGARAVLLRYAKDVSKAPLAVNKCAFTGYTVQRLQVELQGRGLNANGRRSELLERLVAGGRTDTAGAEESGRGGVHVPVVEHGRGVEEGDEEWTPATQSRGAKSKNGNLPKKKQNKNKGKKKSRR
jgi:hypothetical protein